jgi:hypothetical protein
MKFGHKSHLNTKNKFPKESFFSKSNDYPFDFVWTKKPRFWGNEEKYIKSNGVESWVHSKDGGKWWGSSYHPNPWKKSKKNSSKLMDKKSDENTPKIIKKKNDPYNMEMIFTHKD